MKKILSFVAGTLALFMTISAFAIDLSVKYDVDNYELSLGGTAYAPVSVIVYASDASELSTDSGATIAATHYEWRGETAINETIPLDPNLPSGTYILRARTNEQYMNVTSDANRLYGVPTDNKLLIEKSFYHINTTDAGLLLTKINEVSNDASALSNLISQGTVGSYNTPCIELLDLDKSKFDLCGSYVCRQMVGTKKGADYASLQEVKELLTEYILLYDISKAASAQAAITLIENNKSVFGEANVNTYVSNLSASAKEKFFNLLKSFVANGRAFSQEIPYVSALATVQSADRWQIIKNVITDTHKSVVNINYNVNNVDQVFQQMMSYTYTVYSDISAGFSKANAAVNNATYVPPVNNTGSTGGGGGSFQVAPPATEQRGENASQSGFSDVPSDFWGYNAIMRLSELGVVSGYPNGTFAPNDFVTRAEFVKMLCTAFNINAIDTNLSFNDVSSFDWHYDYIRRAYGAGLINGVSQMSFNPNSTITREDACTVVYRYLSSKGVLTGVTAQFTDTGSFADYSKDAIAYLAGNGIVNGVGDGIFDAKGNITRAACATLICNCLDFIK